MIATRCDGSTVEFDPVWEDTHCNECGHVSSRISNVPSFHGDSVRRGDGWYCSLCGDQFLTLAIVRDTLDRIRPKIIEAMEQQNSFYRYFRGGQR